MKTYAQTKVCRSRAKGKFEFIGKIMESDEAILCKSDHCKSVVFSRNRKASGGDIYVGNGGREKSEIDRFDSVVKAERPGDVHLDVERAKKAFDFRNRSTHNNHR